MLTKERADQIAGGVFLVGLGLLFTNVLPFWPGILFVIGASTIARGVAQGQTWYTVPGGLGIIAIGLVFMLGFNLPLILILIGVAMLFGFSTKKHWWTGCDDDNEEAPAKRKNREKRKHDDVEESGVFLA